MKRLKQQKNIKRLFAFITIVAVVCSILPVGYFTANSAKAEMTENVTLSSPVIDKDGVTIWDCVYFGNYYQSDATGTRKEPIKWRVLSVNGNDAFLLADMNLDCQPYHTEYESVTWETCTLRSWLNGYGSGNNSCETDYSNSNFIDTAFSEEEQSAIMTTGIESSYQAYTEDKIFLLSILEICDTYGFNGGYLTDDESKEVLNTAYAKKRGAYTSTAIEHKGYGEWWLRSNVYNMHNAACITSYGDGYGYGRNVDSITRGIRPVLHLNLEFSSVWKYASKVSSTGSSIQCGSLCSVAKDSTTYMPVCIYGSDSNNLELIVDSVKWEVQDESVAMLGECIFLSQKTCTIYEAGDGTYEVWKAIGFLPITGVAEGNTMIMGVVSDGSTAIFNVMVGDADSNIEDSDSAESLILGEDVTGIVEGNAADLFPDTWSLKSMVFPVEISKTKEEDGSYKIKGAIGAGKSDWLDDESKWNKFKSNVSDAQRYSGRVACLEKYRETWGVKSLAAVSTDSFEVLPKLSVMGYFENTYDKNGNLVSQTGKIAADAEWNGSISWQFITPIGPFYVNLEGSGKVSGSIGPKYDYETQKLQVLDGELQVIPSIALEGGYGIDKVATVGAQGGLSLPVTIIPATKGEFEAVASIHVKLAFVIDYTYELTTYKKTLWDTTGDKKSIRSGTGIEIDEGTLSAMDTSFSAYTGEWNRGISRVRGMDNGENEILLQEGILPSSLPMQMSIDGKKVMVFQKYDESRDVLNSSVLMYSVCKDGIWSEPQPVWDNGCCDMYADMKVVDGRLVLAWQKLNGTVTGDIETDGEAVTREIARNSEICFAEFDADAGVFINQTYVTDNTMYDMMPEICSNGNEVVISWVRNDMENLMQEDGTNTIYTASWNGSSFEKEEVLAESYGTVEEYVTYMDGTDVKVFYVAQTDSGEEEKITAVFDESGQVPDAFSNQVFSAAESSISDVHYADEKINFLSGGVLHSYNITDETMTSYTAGESVFGSTAQYCSNGEKSGYVWSIYDEETETGKIVASMKTEIGYSKPVTLYEKKGVMWRYISSVLDNDGNWSFLTNAMQTEDGEEDRHSLLAITKNLERGVELAGASVDEDDVEDGLTGVDYFVTNTGDTAIDNLQITITLSDGKVIKKEIPVTILPGESMVDTAYVDLSEVDTTQEVSISVCEKEQPNVEDCTVSNIIGRSDVKVTGTVEELEDKVIITAKLSNSSFIDADTTLYLYSDEKQTSELCVSKSQKVKAGESSLVQMEVEKEDIIYNENNAAYLTLKAVVTDGDCNEDNNTDYVVLYRQDSEEDNNKQISSAKKTVATADIVLAAMDYAYNGKEKKPAVKAVTLGTTVLKAGKDYIISYINNKNIGTATVIITGIGNYTGTVQKTFTISARKGTTFTAGAGKYKIAGVSKVAFVGLKSSKTKKLTIPGSVKIGGKIFKVTSIVNKALVKKKVSSVTIGANVKKIGKEAFKDCNRLKMITIKSTKLKSVGKNALKGIKANAKIKVPKKNLSAYKKLLKSRGQGKKVKIVK